VLTNRVLLFDSHLHIVDPRFPLVANQGFVPAPFTVADYRRRMAGYRLAGGAVVSGSFQAFDQQYLLDALRRLGPTFVGVTQLPATVSDAQLLALHRAGVRALRFNLQRGGSAGLHELDRLARRVHEVAGWHVELYADASDLAELLPTLIELPAVSVDHLGLSRRGLRTLVRLVQFGVRVKATGFGRVDFDVRHALRELVAANPEAVLFGSDLPSTRAPRPYADADVGLIVDTIGEADAARVLCDNALQWYRVCEHPVSA